LPRLLNIIENLTNWYIRFNRKRLKGAAGLGDGDTKAALSTLLHVLFTIIRALAPFAPFITEHIYSLLKSYLGDVLAQFQDARSVHFLPFPTVHEALFNEEIEREVLAMQKVIQLSRTVRERNNIALKTPLLSLVVIADEQVLSDVQSLQSYIKEELNVLDVTFTNDEEKYGILLGAKVDWSTLGKKLKKDVQKIRKALPNLTQDQLKRYVEDKKIVVDGIELDENDLTIVRILGNDTTAGTNNADSPKWEAAFSNDIIVLVDTATTHPDQLKEALARDIINRLQKLRKKAGLVPTDDVRMQYRVSANVDDVDINKILSSRESQFQAFLHRGLEPMSDDVPTDSVILEEEQTIGDLSMMLRLVKI
jgi:isoleucyl-tRNA synthetase